MLAARLRIARLGGKVTEKLGKKGYFKMAVFYPVWFDKLKQNESTRDGLTNPY